MESYCQGSSFEQYGIGLAKLPPASPQLNATERFLKELKKEPAHHLFETIEAVEGYLIGILKSCYDSSHPLIRIIQYPYAYLIENGTGTICTQRLAYKRRPPYG